MLTNKIFLASESVQLTYNQKVSRIQLYWALAGQCWMSPGRG